MAEELRLSDEELAGTLRSGATVFTNRVAWALAYLFKTGLVDRPTRGTYVITERGRKVLAENPTRVDLAVLRQFPEFGASARQSGSREPRRASASLDPGAPRDTRTPDELIVDAYERLRATTADDLMVHVLAASPAFFERLVLDVLTAMGYGGSRLEAARHLGRSGDEGVDGVIHEDRLGLDVIYVQAKRWGRDRTVG